MDQLDRSKFNHETNPKVIIESIDAPALLMQADPRQVVTGNKKVCEMFGKNLEQIEGFRGGQIFNCIHSFSEEGCGKDENCENCKIKEAVVGTFETGKPYISVQEVLEIKEHNETSPYDVQVSTKKIGDFAIVTIDKYSKKA